MRLLFFVLFIVFNCGLPPSSLAQKQGYIWAFGNKAGIDFNTGVPIAIATAMDNQFGGNASVCNLSGALLFYTDGNRIWDRSHNLMPNGILLTNSFGSSSAGTWAVNQPAVIVPVPGDSMLYYVFSLEVYTAGYRLWYSMIDIRLNNGQGDVSQRPVLLDAGPLTEAMTVVRGEQCNYWLLVHQKYSDQFRAYNINAAGIDPMPAISHAGTLGAAIFSFGNYNLGGMKMSPDRLKLAGNWSANGLSDYYLELYDFDPVTGRLSDAIRLDGPKMYYFNTCFSPDNAKLYTTGNGYLHQFDLSLGTAAAISASKTDLFGGRFVVTHGDLKRGPDDKIYLALRGTGALHRIDQPNLAGAACNVQPYALPLLSTTDANWGLPNEHMAPLLSERVKTSTQYTRICRSDSLILYADSPGRNYVWYNGYGYNRYTTIYAPGVYPVRYSLDCTHYLDTFVVLPAPVFPTLFHNGSTCQNEAGGMAHMYTRDDDTTSFSYIWLDSSGTVLREAKSRTGDSLLNLPAGRYTVKVFTASGCDSQYHFSIVPISVPQVSFDVKDTACMMQLLSFRNTSQQGLEFVWDFGDGNRSDDTTAEHRYAAPGKYEIRLTGKNEEGCSQSYDAAIWIGLQDFLFLEAERDYADQGQPIVLHTHAAEPYDIIAWLPPEQFSDQQAYRQIIEVDSSRIYVTVGRSEYGCIDSAEVTVFMNPILFLPNAFTPNGDGINDDFAIGIKGQIGLIRHFSIYNRWGEQIWSATGAAAVKGWNGFYRGGPADMGTYYYHIELQTASGRQYVFKGEVALIR